MNDDSSSALSYFVNRVLVVEGGNEKRMPTIEGIQLEDLPRQAFTELLIVWLGFLFFHTLEMGLNGIT